MRTIREPDGSVTQISDAEYLRGVRSGEIAPEGDPVLNMQAPSGEVIAMPLSVANTDPRYRGWSTIEPEQATKASLQYEYSKGGWPIIAGLSSLAMGAGGALAGIGDPRAQEDIQRAREANPGSVLLGSVADIALTLGAGGAVGGLSKAAGVGRAAAGLAEAGGAATELAEAGRAATGIGRAIQAIRAPGAALESAVTPVLGRVGTAMAREAAAGAVLGAAQHAIDSELAGSEITPEGMFAAGATGALFGSVIGGLTEGALGMLERRAASIADSTSDRLLTRATRWLGPSRSEATRMRLAAEKDPLYREALIRTAMDDVPRVAGVPISELDATTAHRALDQLREEIGNDLQELSRVVDATGERVDAAPLLQKLNALAKEYASNPATKARAKEVEGFIDAFNATREQQWIEGKIADPDKLPFSVLADWRSKFGAVKQGALRGGDDLHPAIPIYSILSDALEDGISKAAPKIADTEIAQKLTSALGAPIDQLWAARNARFRAVADLEEIARRGVGREGANRTWSLGDRLFGMTGAFIGHQIGGPIGSVISYGVSAAGGRLIRTYGDQWTASILRMVANAAKNGKPMPVTSALQIATRDAIASIRKGAAVSDNMFARVGAAVGAAAKTGARRGVSAAVSSALPPIKVSLPAAQVIASGAAQTGFEQRTPQFAARLNTVQQRAANVIIKYAPPTGIDNAPPVALKRAQNASDAVIGGLPHVLTLAQNGQLTPTHWAAFSEAYPIVANEIRSAVDDGDLKVPKDVERVLRVKPADPVIQSAIARDPQQPPPNRPMPVSTEAREFETRADRLENSL